MVKVEDFQAYSKDQLEAAQQSFGTITKGFQAIAASFTDFSKKSFEEGGAYFEKLAGVKSLDKAIEVQTEFAKSSYENFVAEATKLSELYAGLAKEAYKPVESYLTKVTPAR